MPRKKTWVENWGANPVDYTKSPEALRKELRKVRNLTARRVASLEKGKSYSYAAYQFNQSINKLYIKGNYPNLDNMSYQQIERELRTHHDFWSSETSTHKGAKRVQEQQSKAFFGTDKRGRAKHIMTLEEGRKLWSLYNEFYNMYKDSTAKYDSTRLQRIIGITMEQSNFDSSNFIGTLEKVRTIMEEDFENPFESSIDIAKRMEVFSGYGNDF